MMLRTKVDTDIGADDVTLQGGGSTGWHSLLAMLFVTVVRGSVRWFDGSDPACPGHVYGTGQSFIENSNNIHNAVNASGSAKTEFIAVRMNPTGVPFVNDEGKPTNCN